MKRIFTLDNIIKAIIIAVPLIVLAVYLAGNWYKR